jgi:hypothetical protein
MRLDVRVSQVECINAASSGLPSGVSTPLVSPGVAFLARRPAGRYATGRSVISSSADVTLSALAMLQPLTSLGEKSGLRLIASIIANVD